MMSARQPLALSLAGFQFTYRSSYFDWRLLHGIDVDNVIRLTDVAAVEDCLATLQGGCFPAERDRLSPANCVQLFRLLQLAVEYCAHLRSAHATLLECYDVASGAAEGWKAAARSYLDRGSALIADSLAAGALSRVGLDATDGARAALEAADRDYNAALDALEAEDSRARHFRFRRQRSELRWDQLHATDVDRLVSGLDVGALEGLLPNLTFGSITNEDEQQLTPHHFGQIIPLAQAALDYVLWQANATGTLLEQAMSALQAACADIPLLTSATQDMHANITSLLLEAQHGAFGGAGAGAAAVPGGVFGVPGGGGSVGASGAFATGFPSAGGLTGSVALGGGGGGLGSSVEAAGYGGFPAGLSPPWPSGSIEVGRSPAASPLRGLAAGLRTASPASPLPTYGRPGSAGAAAGGGSPQMLRVGSSGTAGMSRFGPAAGGGGGGRTSGALEELLAAAAASAGADGGSSALPALELHSHTVELSVKVDAIEQDLRLERSKTEEMRRILTDIRERLNHQRQPPTTAPAHGQAATASGGASPAESLTFTPAAAAAIAAYAAAAGGGAGGGGAVGFGSLNLTSGSRRVSTSGRAAAGGGGGGGTGRLGSAAGVSVTVAPRHADPSPAKVRVFVDEDAIREQERQRAVEVLIRQAEKLKQQMLREHTERRLATSAAAASASLHLQQLAASVSASGGSGGSGGGGGVAGLAARLAQQEAGGRRSRGVSRDSSRHSVRNSSPGGRANRAGSGGPPQPHLHHRRGGPSRPVSIDYSSDPEFAALAAAGGSASGGYGGYAGYGGGRQAGGGAAARPPPKPLSRLSGPTAVHGSLGDLPSAAAGYGGGGGGGLGGGGWGRGGELAGLGSVGDAQRLPLPSLPSAEDSDTAVATFSGTRQLSAPAPSSGPNARMTAAAGFGSISYTGPAAEAAATAAAIAARQVYGGGSGAMSKASSFTERQSPERPTHGSSRLGGYGGSQVTAPGELGRGGGGGGGGGGGAGGGGGSVGGWDAAAAVAASVRGGG